MSENRFFSEKITIISFILSVGIVYLHTPWYAHDTFWGTTFYRLIQSLLHCCVPCFFFISGYLYYRNYTPKEWKRKTTSRIKSLLIPYLIWCTGYGGIMYILTYTGLAHTDIVCKPHSEVILAILNADYCHLWFIRYLIIFSLFAPLFYYILINKALGVGGVLRV